MSSYNRVLILGTLGNHPELRKTLNGRPFCRMSLATHGPGRDSEGKSRTSWHSVHVFGKQAEAAAENLNTGAKVLIEGHMETVGADREGHKVWNTWITADRVTFVSGAFGAKPPKGKEAAGEDAETEEEFFREGFPEPAMESVATR